MTMYNTFKTDPELEKKGVWTDYGSFRVLLSRAGGANKKFQKLLERLTRPHQKAIQTGAFDNDRATALMREVYATTVVLGWEVKVEGEWVKGIEPSDPGSDLLPMTKENLLATFEELPDLFQDLTEQAGNAMLYRTFLLEESAKN